MESSGALSLPIPRLRLTRQGSNPEFDNDSDDILTPQAGPSRLSPGPRMIGVGGDHEINDEADDAQSTPKMPILNSIPEATSSTPTETPAARLRALLSRVPNSSSTNKALPQGAASLSDLDSDFDPPRSSPTNTPSIARESLKELFSRALREPGDTPQKDRRRRRNSIDTSEVEASPRVKREREKYKGKRRSLSDEEADKHSRSGTSLRSSQAATFDTLRARLTNSQTQLMNQHAPFDDQCNSGLSDVPADASDNGPFLRKLTSSTATPPEATSTPQRSMQMPSQLQYQSNLLDQELDIQDAMSFDSYEEEPAPSQRPPSFPPARTQSTPHSAPARPVASASGSKLHSSSRLHGVRSGSLSRRGSADLIDGIPSRASSSQSHADFGEREREQERERNREREREWNKPHPRPRTPEIHHWHSHSHGSSSGGGRSASPMFNLANGLGRRGSLTSLMSFDDGRSSGASSIGSQAEYRERIKELERERNFEREREWNKRHPPTSRPTSSLSMHSHSPRLAERTRTQSHPTRPGSATSNPTTPNLHRRQSSNSSRATSPSSSIRSRDSEKEQELEMKQEIDHIRERNWNSPHPKWTPRARRESMSPLRSSLSPQPSFSHTHTRSQNLRASSPRAESPTFGLHAGKSPLRSSTSHSPLNVDKSSSTDYKSKEPPTNAHPTSHAVRSHSPIPSAGLVDSRAKENGNVMKTAASVSRFGWQFPRNKAQLPPLDLDQYSPERQEHPTHSKGLSSSPTPCSRLTNTSGSARPSHIPVRLSHVSGRGQDSSGLKKGNKRSPTDLSAVGDILDANISEPIPFADSPNQNSVLASDEEQPSPLANSTPTMRPNDLSSASDPNSAAELLPTTLVNSAKSRLQHMAHNSSHNTSSPPSSPSPLSPPILSSVIPGKSFNSLKLEFQIPSPPKGMPELPDSPLHSEDEVGMEVVQTPTRLDADANVDSSMKTPKPPGAWTSTPAPHRDPLLRTRSLPDSDGFGGETMAESSLPTPVASLSRASSLPPQTPAPPGAWMVTPGLEKKRSLLKVRFDVESEQSVSGTPANGRNISQDLSTLTSQTQGNHSSGLVKVRKEAVDTPVTPKTTPPSTPRRSPSIRIVDAFGRDAVGPTLALPPMPNPSAPRSTSLIRIVDAMGREVEEPAEVVDSEVENIPLNHNEAVRQVRQSIADLASGLREFDGSSTELETDDQRLHELNSVSHAARDARHKLSHSLRMAQNAEEELRSRYGSIRANMRRSKILPAVITNSRLPWTHDNALIFWGVVAVQVLLIAMIYHVTTTQAQDIFLNTYYNPFYPELHLYATKPDTFRLSMSQVTNWSIFSIPETLQRDGWKAATKETWDGLSMMIWDWKQQLWNTWGTAEAVPWPPT